MDAALYIRPMGLEDLDRAMALKNAEGWNQTRKDWQFFLDQNPALCQVAVVNGKTVGTVTAIAYQNRLAWIGMMLVDREHRRKGISRKLMHELLNRLSGMETIKLDATPEGQLVYESMGFIKEYTLWRYVRNPGVSEQSGEIPADVFPLSRDELPLLTNLDAAVFGAKREHLLRYLLDEFPGGAWMRKQDRRINGMVICRHGSRYIQLGPLVAETDADAKCLVRTALRRFSDRPLVLDVAADKNEFRRWLEAQGFEQRRPLIRMYYRRNTHAGVPDKYYLIAGPELG
ncbi:Ribosomal protein S18 acetylase RimI [Cyclobacterium xiamenense]|uniref:Ribosomal protein S18 acetylase RimI n=1 Tax=Cyclobacterium xiamenense TaxID=1297121 RepID=A0A1H6YN62_9BACT|nr:GNAT family N-acetyltransferase [Cyclobacterium xiamenense]SEJ41284.1 Ribosomal protein S18 acetylase RimI [Cyclobacterium xiamenense]